MEWLLIFLSVANAALIFLLFKVYQTKGKLEQEMETLYDSNQALAKQLKENSHAFGSPPNSNPTGNIQL